MMCDVIGTKCFAFENSHILRNALSYKPCSNWTDHCQRITKAFGVVSQRTPHGLQWEEFQNALRKFECESQQK
jgi:hypothetical protein